MSDLAKRFTISVLALGAVALYGFWTVLLLVLSLCEEADEAARQTVRCDHERGHAWVVLQQVLVAAGAVVLLAGVAWALRRPSFRALLAAALLAAATAFAVHEIGDVRLADKPVPRLSAVRVLDRRCVAPCAAGVRVAFTTDRSARVVLGLGPESNSSIRFRPYRNGGYRYRSGVVPAPGALPDEETDFGRGRHRVRVGGIVEVMGARARREALPPGLYVLQIRAYVPNAGNQPHQAGRTFSSAIRILGPS